MDTVDISLIAVFLIGISIVSIILWKLTKENTGRHQIYVALMTLSMVFEICAYFPQLVQNSNEGATDNIRPTFLIFATLAILCKLPGERNILKETIRENIKTKTQISQKKELLVSVPLILAQTSGLLIPIIFYITWQIQVATLNGDVGIAKKRKTACLISSIIFTVVLIGSVWWIYRGYKKEYKNVPKKARNTYTLVENTLVANM